MEFCPVCVLRKALADGVESAESSAADDTVEWTTPEQAARRFEHYEVVMGEDGKPIELGRGARGAPTRRSMLVHFFEHGRWGSPVEND